MQGKIPFCKRARPIVCYTLYGIFFDVCFPLVAWAFDFWYHGYSPSWDNLGAIHRNNPMLYMIDTAPLFLGIFAFVAGRHKASTERYSLQLQDMVQNLEHKVDERTEELRLANTQLAEAASQASAFAESKAAFLANMSHEIRTPLNAIIGMATIAQKQLVPPVDAARIGQSIRQILTSSDHLLRLINNILDLSKLDAGELTLAEDAFGLTSMLEEAGQMLLPRCQEKHIHFVVETEGCAGLYVRSDRLRLTQVFINLAGNAIKFTPEGGTIHLMARVLNLHEGQAQVYFAVRDSGIGISEENIKQLFQRFKQVQNDPAYNVGGTGLGLTISQRIIELLGGKIEATSKVGQGSTFFFTIPLDVAEAMHEETVVEDVGTPDLHGKRILLADDVEVNRLIVEELLADTGVTLEMAEDGAQALRMFEESAPGYYDLVFMDVQMPHMDGYEATRCIRALNHPNAKDIPIIAMTANAMREDAQKSETSGMNGHLSKPIDYPAMLALLQRYLGKK